MFCPNCGAELADDAKFCGRCGNQIETKPQVQPQEEPAELPVEPAFVAEQPVYAPPVAEQPVFTAPQPVAEQPLGRMKYISKRASGKVKAMCWVSWIACILCVAVLFAGVYTAVATPILELPIIKTLESAIPELDNAMDDLEEELKQGADQLKLSEQEFEMVKDQLPKEKRKTAETFFEATEGFEEDMSLVEWRVYLEGLVSLEDEELQDILDLKVEDDIQELADGLDGLFMVSVALLSALALVLLVGVLFKLNSLTVIAMILLLPAVFVMGGLVFAIAFFALCVVAIVAHCIINGSYRKYRKSILGIA